ncbi:hypothetical protein [Vibrio parahaemolyticus]|uniref:hypothetical protein n=1 Tax=Vibrio parahaemolyticus TaxID=670 RepID=UPI0023625642|nr:hypothetical protein [Vibrio parahaemolyticus]EIA1588316.1 hypothetical protein [Vibrio parahaemolyticus]EJG0778549.1 hypothetical protein [Vibrio parahaemolyticus]
MKRKEPNTEPPRRLTDDELEELRKEMQESSSWVREELSKRKEARSFREKRSR